MEIMGYRNITVKDDVYERLEATKREKESFNALLKRMLNEQKSKSEDALRAARGLWADMTDKEEKALRNEFKKAWRNWDERVGQRPFDRKSQKQSPGQ